MAIAANEKRKESKMKKQMLCVAIAVGLGACGGGSSDSPTPTPPTVSNTPASFTGNLTATINAEQSTASGTVTVSDPDQGQNTASAQSNVTTTYGTFTIATNGQWTYTLDTSNPDVQNLADPNDSLTDAISVLSADGSTATINVTILGVPVPVNAVLQKGNIGENDSVPDVICTSTVSSISALEEAVSFSMTPGETLCLASGNYTGLDIDFGGNGSADAPITIAAQEPGSVFIDGEVFIGMTGEYVVLQGFVFQNGSMGSSLLQTRANSSTPCNNCRITENSFIDMDANQTNSTKWFQIYGSNNRFDHNWVSGKTTRGALFVIERGDAPGTEDRTQIDHNYFGDRPPKDGLAYADGSDNEYEGIRIGSSSTHTSDSFAVIEHNFFEGIDGEAEVISIKAGKVTVRHNTVRNSRGSIVNRHGEGARIDNNFIIGDANPFSGGIRIVDADHSVTNNYISGARYLSTNFNGGILISNSNGSTTNGYQDVENVFISNNTIVDSVNSLNFYAGSQSTRPDSVYFVNNIVDNAIGAVVRNSEILPTNFVSSGNIVHGSQLSDDSSVTSIGGLSFVDAMLSEDTQGIARPSANSPNLASDLTANTGSFTKPEFDMDGQTRLEATLSGADGVTTVPATAINLRGLLSKELVGPLTYTPPQTTPTIQVLNINNNAFDSGDFSAWTTTGATIVSTDQEAFSRSHSAQVVGGTGEISQSVAVNSNTNYTLSAFVKGEGSLKVDVDGQQFSTDQDSSSYRFTSVSFNSGAATSVDISGTVVNSVINNVTIVNPDFDDDQNGWVINEGNGIGQVQDSDNSSSNTDGSIKFKYNDTDSGTPYQPYIAQTVSVEPNTEYTLTMYILLKSSDAQDATVLFGVHTGEAVVGGVFDSTSIVSSKNAVYANLSEQNEAEDSFRPDTISFNSGSNTRLTIFAQYQSSAGDDIRIDEFSLTSSGAPSSSTTANFDDFRLVSHPKLSN